MADSTDPKPAEKITAALDEFMATVLRHVRTGESDPLEEMGLDKSRAELQNWHPDVPGAVGGPADA
jgi:hypothetical protein